MIAALLVIGALLLVVLVRLLILLQGRSGVDFGYMAHLVGAAGLGLLKLLALGWAFTLLAFLINAAFNG